MDKPEVSIVIATYNGASYITQQIDSILNQSLQDFEIIIVDDCSTDQTIELLEKYNDPRLKIIQNATNLGVLANFEKGMQLASARYIVLGDQDDHWDIEKCATLLRTIKQEKALMVYSNARLIDSINNDLGKSLKDYNPLVGTTQFSDIFPFQQFCLGLHGYY